MAEEEMVSMIDDDEIDHVFVEFPDLNGMSRSKQLDADYFLSSLETGFSMNLSLITQTHRSDVVEKSKYGAGTDFADGIVRPDPETCCRVPWRDDAARVICDFEFQGEAVSGSPRTVLSRVLDRIDERGFDTYAGSELEFFLLDPTDDGYAPVTSEKHENLTRATESISSFYDRVYEWAESFDIDLNTLHHEYGAGQFEILFDYGEPLGQADRTFRFKELVKHTARTGDQHATFMAKPFTDHAGSGYHLHVSLFEDGENVLEADEESGQLSERGRQFVGGLLEHVDALSAFGTPNLNGFKRYEPGTFAPYSASWGYGNRMTAVRVPMHGETRIENRISSADANPYLVIAATLAAGFHGIEAELEPPEPSDCDPSTDRPRLPRSPHEALDRLEEDRMLARYMGAEVIHEYVSMKRQEIESFYSQTTEWERNEYVETL